LSQTSQVYLLSIFYTRKEIATRIAILYTGNILATAFAGLIAAGIFHGMDRAGGLSGWQWLFILQGAVTFLIAVIGFFLLPDFPHNTWWLTPEERLLATSRMELDTVGNTGEKPSVVGLRQATTDPVVWLFAFMAHMHLAANGFKNFFPTVVETLGFTQTITLVLTCPPYFIAGATTIFASWLSGKLNERTWHITVSKAIAIIGFVVGATTTNIGVRYFAMVVFCIGTYAVNSLILGWVGSTCGQTKEKKAAAIGIVSTIMNASFIWTPVSFSFQDYSPQPLLKYSLVSLEQGRCSKVPTRHVLERCIFGCLRSYRLGGKDHHEEKECCITRPGGRVCYIFRILGITACT
jgi:hypothetical protein